MDYLVSVLIVLAGAVIVRYAGDAPVLILMGVILSGVGLWWLIDDLIREGRSLYAAFQSNDEEKP